MARSDVALRRVRSAYERAHVIAGPARRRARWSASRSPRSRSIARRTRPGSSHRCSPRRSRRSAGAAAHGGAVRSPASSPACPCSSHRPSYLIVTHGGQLPALRDGTVAGRACSCASARARRSARSSATSRRAMHSPRRFALGATRRCAAHRACSAAARPASAARSASSIGLVAGGVTGWVGREPHRSRLSC